MENNYAKRLIEVDMPIRRVSAHARREKSIRHGHISTLHIWWARRPLAACRAVLCAALWFDPCDPLCPAAFRGLARETMRELAQNNLRMFGAESLQHFSGAKRNPSLLVEDEFLRQLLFDFIADFANWDNSTNPDFLDAARFLTHVAHLVLTENLEFQEAFAEYENDHQIEKLKSKIESLPKPLVVDPFAGGGAIPLEALRVGADAFASDLNPVAVLLNKVVLEYIPKYGERLANAVREYGEVIKNLAERELNGFYPSKDDEKPVAYLWGRTILSDAPSEDKTPVEVPLFRTTWLTKKRSTGNNWAFRWVRDANDKVVTEKVTKVFEDGVARQVLQPKLEIYQPKSTSKIDPGTSKAGSATCPVTGFTTSVEKVREQLKKRRGSTADARLLCVVTTNPHSNGKSYRLPYEFEIEAAKKAKDEIERRKQQNNQNESLVPDGELNHLRGFFNVVLYGMTHWGDLFSPRQALALTVLVEKVREIGDQLRKESDVDFAAAVQTCLALALDRQADYCSSLCSWVPSGEFVGHTFGRQALPMIWDYIEPNIFSDSGWAGACEWVRRVISSTTEAQMSAGESARASATDHPLSNESVDAVITDPPYYAAIPYADLSDFFYSWLKRSVGDIHKDLFQQKLAPKDAECVSLSHRAAMYRHKDAKWFEDTMAQACAESQRIAKTSGIGVFVFANKETSGWEAMLAALISSKWVITASWAIDTEMGTRLRAQNSAALASSIHLVCRPRSINKIGDYGQVLLELPRRINEWLPRLASEGIVGADAIFACIGPALEIFSRYERVERTNGETVGLREYLELVWAAVAKEALSMIFAGADASGFEPDARITAMWLWTLSTARDRNDLESRVINAMNPDEEEAETDADDDEESSGKKKVKGFVLEYDAARKIAQGLGVNLDAMEICEVKGETARLLPVKERARQLFGSPADETATVTATRGRRKVQQSLFGEMEEAMTATVSGWHLADESRRGATVLDRLHQAMIFFAAGRGEALRRFLVDDGVGADERFWRLANALSALYPKTSEEKRWVDGILAKKKGLGF